MPYNMRSDEMFERVRQRWMDVRLTFTHCTAPRDDTERVNVRIIDLYSS